MNKLNNVAQTSKIRRDRKKGVCSVSVLFCIYIREYTLVSKHIVRLGEEATTLAAIEWVVHVHIIVMLIRKVRKESTIGIHG